MCWPATASERLLLTRCCLPTHPHLPPHLCPQLHKKLFAPLAPKSTRYDQHDCLPTLCWHSLSLIPGTLSLSPSVDITLCVSSLSVTLTPLSPSSAVTLIPLSLTHRCHPHSLSLSPHSLSHPAVTVCSPTNQCSHQVSGILHTYCMRYKPYALTPGGRYTTTSQKREHRTGSGGP